MRTRVARPPRPRPRWRNMSRRQAAQSRRPGRPADMKRLLLALAVTLAVQLHADDPAEPAPPATARPKLTDDQLRIRGIFNTSLPGAERKNSLRFIFHPHFG